MPRLRCLQACSAIYSSPTIASNTIIGNTVDPSYNSFGGGIFCESSSSPSIVNNMITGNRVSSAGGGIYCCSTSSPAIVGNTITGNSAIYTGGLTNGAGPYGGGIHCVSSSAARITSNIITANTSALGGGISCASSSATIASNTIIGNNAVAGGEIFYGSESPTVVSNVIAGNSATNEGGGIACWGSSPLIVNNTVTNNSASYYGGGVYCYSSPSALIVNTIIAFNSSGIYSSSGTPTFRYNCVYGNGGNDYSGLADPTGTDGNISADPRFADASYGNIHIQQDSPCVDAGNNADVPADTVDPDGDGDTTEPQPFDLAGAGRFADDPYTADTGAGPAPIVDIGAYEHHLADASGDGHVDVLDLLYLVYSFGTLKGDAGFDPTCDFNHDGAVDVLDLLDLAYNFGK